VHTANIKKKKKKRKRGKWDRQKKDSREGGCTESDQPQHNTVRWTKMADGVTHYWPQLSYLLRKKAKRRRGFGRHGIGRGELSAKKGEMRGPKER
jgi:hypothetical protein